jgi:hypothetical protein
MIKSVVGKVIALMLILFFVVVAYLVISGRDSDRATALPVSSSPLSARYEDAFSFPQPADPFSQEVTIDYPLAKEAGIQFPDGDTPSYDYLHLQGVYKLMFSVMLDQDTRLFNYDEDLANMYGSPNPSDISFAQKYSSFGRSVIFLDNDFAIENLSADEIKDLRATANTDPIVIDSAFYRLVENTYPKVIAPTATDPVIRLGVKVKNTTAAPEGEMQDTIEQIRTYVETRTGQKTEITIY